MTDLIAHRGFAKEASAPENSASAVRSAADAADAIEVDIRRCGSGELVVYHDDRLDRLTDASGPVDEADFETLRNLNLDGSDAQIPTPAEIFEAVPDGTPLYLHLKEPGLTDELLSVYFADDNWNEFTFTSESKRVLNEIPSLIPSAHSIRHLPDGDVEQAITETLALGCGEIHPHQRICVETNIVEQAHAAGLRVAAWTARTEEQVAALLDTGVDAIHCDIIPDLPMRTTH